MGLGIEGKRIEDKSHPKHLLEILKILLEVVRWHFLEPLRDISLADHKDTLVLNKAG